ncbi:GDSL esterase/lipase At1g29670-like [Gossypium hirsutum]|uniref:GDSL esterase/lipase At1g29670-like n=1 Tax=Gossypium hirsutum TaxID=3635 RepID=A0ABM3A158_GOSHI|nr:GDSL esterase/lipase At1g29670-like [Gossypium hirsutum]
MKKYMSIVGTGGNDYLFNYFGRKGEYNASLETFTANLTTSLSLQLKAAVLFNNELKSIIDRVKFDIPTSNLVLVNSYNIVTDIIQNFCSRGFKDANNPCCEVVPLRQSAGNGISCKKGGRICMHRSAHVFFDGLHPTEKVNVEIATKAFTSKRKTEVYPIHVNQLPKL